MNLFDLLLGSNEQLIKENKELDYEKVNNKPALDKWSISMRKVSFGLNNSYESDGYCLKP